MINFYRCTEVQSCECTPQQRMLLNVEKQVCIIHDQIEAQTLFVAGRKKYKVLSFYVKSPAFT